MGLYPRSMKTKTTLLAASLFSMHVTLLSSVAGANSQPAVSIADARRLVIRLINADSGAPMSHQNVQVEWDADAEESIIYVGGAGRGTMDVLANNSIFTMKPGVKDYGDPNRLAFFSCSGPTIAVPVQQATKDGFVSHNECTDRTAQAKPGEIVFWARPLPLWKPDFQ
jgi:hypothetical protein